MTGKQAFERINELQLDFSKGICKTYKAKEFSLIRNIKFGRKGKLYPLFPKLEMDTIGEDLDILEKCRAIASGCNNLSKKELEKATKEIFELLKSEGINNE